MISDVRMPGLTGLETLRLARQEHARLPILLVTAFTDVRDAVDAIRDAERWITWPSRLTSGPTARSGAPGHGNFQQRAVEDSASDRQLPPNVIAASSADAGDFPGHFAHRAFRKQGAHHGRKRRGPGSDRGNKPCLEPPCRRAHGESQLRGHPGEFARERIIRPRKRLVHRGGGPAHRAFRNGEWRDDFFG